MNADKLEDLAARVEACVEDVKRPEPVRGDPFDPLMMLERLPDPRIISLANGLEAVAIAIRALAQQEREHADKG